MYYEINVTLYGKHFFATAERSITDLDSLKRVYCTLAARFTSKDGFSLSVKLVKISGHSIDTSEWDKMIKGMMNA